MYKVTEEFCERPEKNGLLLMDLPTGTGKTFYALNYIYNEIRKFIYNTATDKSNEDKKFFFITSLKKNLPEEDLRKFFKSEREVKEFQEKFLFLDSNLEFVLKNLTDDLIEKIPEEIRTLEQFKRLEQEVRTINRLTERGGIERSVIDNMKENLRLFTEPEFRRLIKGMLSKQYKTVDERLLQIKTNFMWKWLGELYPAVFIKEKQIIFMSMDKFMSRNSPIVESSYLFYGSDIFDDAVVFIDEFDAAKETMMKNIISNGLKDKIDYIDFFKSIHSALQTNAFPAKLVTESRKSQENPTKYPDLQKVIDNMRSKANELYNKYFLNFSHKTIAEEGARNFVFQDFDYLSILDGNKSCINIYNDKINRINSIEFADEKKELPSNIYKMLGELRGFISYFRGGVGILATNYLQCKKEAGNLEYTRESAIKSVLEEFHLKRNYIEYITMQLLTLSYKSLTKSSRERQDLTFYSNGFRFYSFEDSADHDMHSKIMFCNFTQTPEQIILKLCERAKVIGISATATLPTVLGNFDIDYFRIKLQDSFVTPSDDDRKRMKENFEQSIVGYKDVNIKVQLLGSAVEQDYSVDSWRHIFSNMEYCEKTFNTLERLLPGKEYVYQKARYFRIAGAYKEFLLHDDIRSFLCILTKHPRRGDKTLDLDVLYKMFNDIVADLGIEFNVGISVEQLDGTEYDAAKEQIIRRLAAGEKLFVISVYQTIGAGQNLQYPVPEDLKGHLVKINDLNSSEDKDFDAIYLDKPTNLLVNLDNKLSEENFAKYIFQSLYLQESFEISRAAAAASVKKAFRSYVSQVSGHYWEGANLYNCPSVSVYATRVIIQAIGRMCRTNLKQKNIYVFADSRVKECMIPGLETRMLNPEFESLYKYIVDYETVTSSRDTELKNKAGIIAERTNRHIRNMLHEGWTSERIEEWNLLRAMALKNPCFSDADARTDFAVGNFYVQLPEKNNVLFYRQEEDFNKVTVSFEKSKDTPLTVSAEAAKLDRFMEVPLIRKHFEKEGYAIDFEKNDYIISPTYFNNIYKGALGEVVGKLLLETFVDVELEEIHEIEYYELFDFKVKELPVYVDFKNWHETTTFDDDEMIRKIIGKAKACGCKCAVIVNIMTQQEYRIVHRQMEDITVIEIPSLLIDDGNEVRLNEKAFEFIRRYVYELRNKDEQN